MDRTRLDRLAEDLIEQARQAHSGRAAHTVVGGSGHALRPTAVALREGQEMAEHNSPGEATLQVLHGRVRLDTAAASIEAAAGDLVVIPPERHGLAALEDSVVLLSVVTR